MQFLDTSIPLTVMLKEENEFTSNCYEIMEAIENGKENAITTIFTVAELFHIMVNREKISCKKANEYLNAFLSCKGLKLIKIDEMSASSIVSTACKYNLDFVDSINFLAMKKNNVNEIFSIDKDYDKIKEITRLDSLKMKYKKTFREEKIYSQPRK